MKSLFDIVCKTALSFVLSQVLSSALTKAPNSPAFFYLRHPATSGAPLGPPPIVRAQVAHKIGISLFPYFLRRSILIVFQPGGHVFVAVCEDAVVCLHG